MKKIIALLILIIISANQARTQEKVEVDGIFYELAGDNATVTKNESIKGFYKGNITLPASIKYNNKTYNVTSIGEMAFSYCENLTSITMPNSVASIGSGAFAHCKSLTSVTIPDKVKIIDQVTFASCSNLAAVTIPESVTSIETVAFTSCHKLKDIYLNNRKPLAIYVSDAFSGVDLSACRLHVPKGAKEFYADAWPAFTTIIDDLDAIPGTGVQKNVKVDGIYYELHGQNATVVRDLKFNTKSELYSGNIKIPANIKFDDKTYAVTSIGKHAFYGCPELISVSLPNTVTSIGESSFTSCTKLSSVNLPDMLVSIGSEAFGGCESLTSVAFPESVTSIGSAAFIGCKSLTSVTLSQHLKSIEEFTFSGCNGLTSVTIPKSVTTIGSWAFSDCVNLKDIYVKHSMPPRVNVSDAFYGIDLPACRLHVPNGSKEFYSYQWNVFRTIVEEESLGKIELDGIYYELDGQNAAVTCNGTGIFDIKPYSGNVVIPGSITYNGKTYRVTSIGEDAFMYSSEMTSVTIPNTVTSIEDSAFDSCTGLTSINIPNSVKSIGASAFSYCTGLTSVTLPKSVISIEPTAFSICHGLKSIQVDPENENYSSGNGILFSKDKKTLVIFPRGIHGSVIIPNGVLVIGREAFATGKVTSVVFPNSVTTIENGAFFNSPLRSVYIPHSVVKLGEGVFTMCGSLKEIYLYGTNPPVCSEKTFDRGATLNCTLHVPASSKAVYIAAKGWGDFVSILEK